MHVVCTYVWFLCSNCSITYLGGKNSDVTVNQFDFGILNFAFYSWLQLNRQTVGGKKNNDVIVN